MVIPRGCDTWTMCTLSSTEPHSAGPRKRIDGSSATSPHVRLHERNRQSARGKAITSRYQVNTIVEAGGAERAYEMPVTSGMPSVPKPIVWPAPNCAGPHIGLPLHKEALSFGNSNSYVPHEGITTEAPMAAAAMIAFCIAGELSAEKGDGNTP